MAIQSTTRVHVTRNYKPSPELLEFAIRASNHQMRCFFFVSSQRSHFQGYDQQPRIPIILVKPSRLKDSSSTTSRVYSCGNRTSPILTSRQINETLQQLRRNLMPPSGKMDALRSADPLSALEWRSKLWNLLKPRSKTATLRPRVVNPGAGMFLWLANRAKCNRPHINHMRAIIGVPRVWFCGFIF